jgi:S1-C subfamily serine protease
VVDGWGVGGPARGYVTRGKELTLGPVTIPNVVASFSVQKKGAFSDASYQGNVGGGILKRFIVTFDYDHQIMYLKPQPGPVADTGVFDRSGMWINQAKDGMDVMDLTAGGPAAKAGVELGDVITMVNGKKTTAIPVYELRRMLRNAAAGTVVTLTIKNAKGTHETKLTLADQI